jgi:glycine oxidase
MQVGFEDRGALYIAAENERFRIPALSVSDVKRLEPALADHPAVYFLKEQSVDPRLLVQATLTAAKHMGVVVHHECGVASVNLTKEHQLEVHTSRGLYSAAIFVNCAGAWASDIEGIRTPTRPVKGQMLAVIPQDCDLRHTVRSHDVYLVPRKDGRVLIGSTLEEAGFDKTVDPTTIRSLHQIAGNLVPSIGEGRIIEAWAGLRPGSPDNLPILGPGHIPGTYVATGHFRNGILLAPITAMAMSELIQGKHTRVNLRPFAPARLSESQALAV